MICDVAEDLCKKSAGELEQKYKVQTLALKVNVTQFADCEEMAQKTYKEVAREIPEAKKILEYAANNGINFFDTSDMYGEGEAERIIGETLGGRDDIIIATKCGFTKDGTRNFEPDYIESCLEGSLKRLQRDCIDVFQLTKPSLEVIMKGEIFRVFEKLKSEGKIQNKIEHR